MKRIGCIAGATVMLLTGCVARPKSTVMTVDDYQEIAADVGQKLAEALAKEPEFADRRPDSPEIVIAVQKVLNLSSDVLSMGGRWYLMERMVASSGIKRLRQEKNIRFVIPAERLREAQRKGAIEAEAGTERAPTHVLTATLRSVTRSGSEDRTDLYSCEYQLTKIPEGEIVWNDAFEFKRWAAGNRWD